MASIASSLSLPVTTSFGGAHTLWWPPSTSAPRVVLLFIPGNPGVASYYMDFLHSIYTSTRLNQRGIEIVAVSHRGHARLDDLATNTAQAKSHASMRYGSLCDQVQHKLAVLDAIHEQYNAEQHNTDVVIVGHSIGAWIATQVVKARPKHVQALHLLFPTLAWIGSTPNARRISLLCHALTMRLLCVALFLLSLLPVCVVVWMVSLITRQPVRAALATAHLLTTRGAVRNALHMATDEFATVQQLDAPTIEAIDTFTEQPRAYLRSYWAPRDTDGWAPEWIRTQVESALRLHHVHLPRSLQLDTPHTLVPPRSLSLQPITSLAIPNPNPTPVPQSTQSQSQTHPHHPLPNRSSTHCKLAIPHAFCLHHSHHLANIVAYWITTDHIDT